MKGQILILLALMMDSSNAIGIKKLDKILQMSTITNKFEPRPNTNPKDMPTPTMIFHGVNSACSGDFEKNIVEQVHQATKGHVECIEIGNGKLDSYIKTMPAQGKEACDKIKDHAIFGQNQFNVIGLSQGGLLARYIVESCDTKHTVRNFVTVGTPNNGIDRDEHCDQKKDNTRCMIQNKAEAPGLPMSNPMIQRASGPTNYFKIHNKYQEYLDGSIFLPYLNNEKNHDKAVINKQRFSNLNSLTLIKFAQDTVIYPQESAWFGDTTPEGKVLPMEESKIFKEDLIGLKKLKDEGRIDKNEIQGDHFAGQISNEIIKNLIVPPLLK